MPFYELTLIYSKATIQRLNNRLLPVPELQKVIEVKQEVGKELIGPIFALSCAFQVLLAGL